MTYLLNDFVLEILCESSISRRFNQVDSVIWVGLVGIAFQIAITDVIERYSAIWGSK